MDNHIKIEHSDPDRNDWFVVNWCLGNTCTFSCSYCPEGLHDGTKAWPDVSVVKAFIAKVKDQVFPKKVYFEFTGGEVTVYPGFLEICQFCADLEVKVGLISNGSRTVRWWEENKHLFDHVCLSFHPEEGDPDHFVAVAKTLANDVRTHVNIMMTPEQFNFCYAVVNKVKNINNISMALQPLIHDFGDTMFDYNDFQKNIFEKQHELIIKHIKYTKSFQYYRGAMKKSFPDDMPPSVTHAAHRFISQKTNNWYGWDCYAGVEQIIVDMDGSIWIGWCKVGGPIGFIYDEDLQLPTNPTICDKTMCHCNYDIMSTKIKVPGRQISIPIMVVK